MRKRTLCAVVILTVLGMCRMDSQEVVSSAGGEILADQAVGMQIMILKGSIGGPAVYTETHSPTTNTFGLVNLIIGGGTTADDFSAIDWSMGPYFVKIGTDPTGGTDYTLIMGTSQLLSVPYALYANVADTVLNEADGDPMNEKIKSLMIMGDSLAIEEGNMIMKVKVDSSNTNGKITGFGIIGDSLFIKEGSMDTMKVKVDASNTNEKITGFGIVGDSLFIKEGSMDTMKVAIPCNLSLGQYYQGGYIFYLDGSGCHGLVAARFDQSASAEWGCFGTLIGGTSTAIGTGQANTTAILNGCATMDIAARLCDLLVLSGFNDWFLPSKDELNLMWENLADTAGDNNTAGPSAPDNIGGFANGYYWSSTEINNDVAWRQPFYNGFQDFIIKSYNGKNGNYRVRAVRAF